MIALFVLLEIILLAPPYGSEVPMAAGFALMLVVAAVRGLQPVDNHVRFRSTV